MNLKVKNHNILEKNLVTFYSKFNFSSNCKKMLILIFFILGNNKEMIISYLLLMLMLLLF